MEMKSELKLSLDEIRKLGMPSPRQVTTTQLASIVGDLLVHGKTRRGFSIEYEGSFPEGDELKRWINGWVTMLRRRLEPIAEMIGIEFHIHVIKTIVTYSRGGKTDSTEAAYFDGDLNLVGTHADVWVNIIR